MTDVYDPDQFDWGEEPLDPDSWHELELIHNYEITTHTWLN
tara:strand:- start:456 stop:578 length:123 start_codon:yes stop_codon:yes gene_type:complete